MGTVSMTSKEDVVLTHIKRLRRTRCLAVIGDIELADLGYVKFLTKGDKKPVFALLKTMNLTNIAIF